MGFLSVVLVLYLTEAGLSEGRIGALLTLTLLGDTALSLGITTSADRVGRRRMLLVGAALMIFAGLLFAVTHSFRTIADRGHGRGHQPEWQRGRPVPGDRAGVAGRGSPGRGTDARVRLVQPGRLLCNRTRIARRRGAGGNCSKATASLRWPAIGPWCSGIRSSAPPWRTFFSDYRPGGAADPGTRPTSSKLPSHGPGPRASRNNVFRLSALFSLDAFAGGFVVQASRRLLVSQPVRVSPATLGTHFFGRTCSRGSPRSPPLGSPRGSVC